MRRSAARPFADKYNPGQPRGPDGRWVSSGSRLGALVGLAGQNTAHHAEFAAVRRPAELSKLVGVNVRGFKHAASNQAIAHTLKNHGNPSVEKKRGQLAVSASDFRLLPDLARLGEYRAAGPHKSFQPRFVLKAEIDGVGYHYVGEVRAGKKRLDMVSLRKKKGSW